jgi:hypothetical protein
VWGGSTATNSFGRSLSTVCAAAGAATSTYTAALRIGHKHSPLQAVSHARTFQQNPTILRVSRLQKIKLIASVGNKNNFDGIKAVDERTESS